MFIRVSACFKLKNIYFKVGPISPGEKKVQASKKAPGELE
jgi:hypothetical protein